VKKSTIIWIQSGIESLGLTLLVLINGHHTGVGGGPLMTPILLWFGIPPTAAVGTGICMLRPHDRVVYGASTKKSVVSSGWLSLRACSTDATDFVDL
jgi:uncharacterized membrane protein YfcA